MKMPECSCTVPCRALFVSILTKRPSNTHNMDTHTDGTDFLPSTANMGGKKIKNVVPRRYEYIFLKLDHISKSHLHDTNSFWLDSIYRSLTNFTTPLQHLRNGAMEKTPVVMVELFLSITRKYSGKYTNPARGTPDFCKQKLLAPPLEPSNHLVFWTKCAEQFSACTEDEDEEKDEDEDEEPIQNIKGPPPGGA